MFNEYGLPMRGVAWATGHWVWLRQASGPILALVVTPLGNRAEILPQGAEMAMRVPVERLAWSYGEAVAS